jgi:hypothetical protein
VISRRAMCNAMNEKKIKKKIQKEKSKASKEEVKSGRLKPIDTW